MVGKEAQINARITPKTNTPADERLAEILTHSIQTDEDYQALGDLAEDESEDV